MRTRARPEPSPPVAAPLPLHENATVLLSLYGDAMGELFKHVDVALMLKLVCRATRASSPPKTKTPLSALVARLPLLQWARAEGCPWDWRMCAEAALGGHLESLQWLRASGCEWNSFTCAEAAHGGHLAVPQWLRANGCDWSAETCEGAAAGGHLAVLQWARANGCKWSAYNWPAFVRTRKFSHSHNARITCRDAASRGIPSHDTAAQDGRFESP